MSNKTNKFHQSGSAVGEQNVINYLNDYFEIFGNNLKNGNFSAMNTRLPRLIVEKFKKLFQLWDENRILAGSMERNLFEDVFALMYHSFGDDSNDTRRLESVTSFTLECNDCGERFPLRNNDCTYSYEFHKTSPKHLQFTNYFNTGDARISSGNEYGENRKDCIDFSVNPKRSAASKVLPLSQPGLSSCEQPTKFMKPSQKCSKEGSSSKIKKNAAVKSINTVPAANSSSNKIFIREYDTHCIDVVNDVARCLLCNCDISSVSSFVSHMNGSLHEKALRRFALNRGHNKIVGKNILCNLCNANFPKISHFIKHCKKPDHQMKLDKVIDTSQRLELTENDQVDIETVKLKCRKCQKSICGVENLLKHLKSGHKTNTKKAEKIKNDQSKKQTIPVAENSKKQVTVPRETFSVMKFDTVCIAFIENTIQCGLCCCMIPSSINFISHMNGSSHKNLVDKLGVNASHCERIDQYTWRCTLCIVNESSLNEFLVHCKKPDHKSRLNKLIEKNLPTTEKSQGNTLIDVSESRFKCPICRVIVVGLEILYKHFHKTHPYVLQSANGLQTQVLKT